MSTITLRNVKGSALTFAEGDTNFTNLNTDKLENINGESLNDLSNVNANSPQANHALVYDTNTSQWISMAVPGPSALSSDLNCGNFVVSNLKLKEYKEVIHDLGTTDVPALVPSNGNVQKVVIASGLALPAFSNPAAGQSITLTVLGTGAATGISSYVFAGGNKTLTTKSIISILYDGTTYWASIATDFQA
jgi:hypothetical protein